MTRVACRSRSRNSAEIVGPRAVGMVKSDGNRVAKVRASGVTTEFPVPQDLSYTLDFCIDRRFPL
jgi:hypothetical protein